jgi:hypothetical protein
MEFSFMAWEGTKITNMNMKCQRKFMKSGKIYTSRNSVLRVVKYRRL